MKRREFLWTAALGSLALTRLAAAAYPERPLRLIVPFAAGGNIDAVGRIIGAAIGPQLGVPAVVENKPGAGGSIGADMVARAPADGYTLLVGSNGPLTVNPFIQAQMPYDPLKDFAAVGMVGYVPHVLVVNPQVPARDLAELVALSRKQGINAGTSGVGSATHLTLLRINAATGAKLINVPYRGGGALIPDLLGGNIEATVTEFSTALPLHRAGKARIIAIAADHRLALAPELPTLADAGYPQLEAASYVGLLAPAATPAEVLARLQKALVQGAHDPSIAAKLKDFGVEPATAEQESSAGFAAFLRDEYGRSQAAAQRAGIKPE
ncbi:Bug family tripartite tricarboxylate transporter substrate binding protein [Bordetella hinzii]|uniref:Tripartite tricarboxylate transporter substrate binding protein n=2 Tax=Bordetella hinzii TaxID=103855 RepID=A0AAN1VGK5_9BORD|nr:tripartite tricarboxylate transporter substrate binding protein [Bordetella hinzii]AKQ56904.1 Tripartite tricarboxylate transporter family receptor [Bordetella hinzii]AKQ61370.1 Tripartite tricarboxylate transporter family receptor [Bordetella hinzii]AZW17653.1 tripartite tricarboxylate transporter substrate binding protein [Bordetella hinzii]KCB23916.1 tripartite tricarboxylate transporter family receptor [Bordetella hinzii OH87 BAL007II]KCB26348.1 tripartite tricarboxylate transporter fam